MKLIITLSLWLFTFFQVIAQDFKIGDNVPNFKLWLVNGDKITKNDIQNKVVVFKFWFTSCLPCLTDIPELNALVKSYKNTKEVLFLAPALERRPVLETFLKLTPFNFKIAYSSIEASQSFNKKQVYPAYFVIDKKGKFIYVDKQHEISQTKAIENAIQQALKE